MLAQERVNSGAIKSILGGANVMCPGLTTPGGQIASVPKNTIVVSTFNTDLYKDGSSSSFLIDKIIQDLMPFPLFQANRI